MKNPFKKQPEKRFIIPLELTDSFARTHERKTTHSEFQKWFSAIIHHYHPINNQAFNLTVDKY